jgi:WD40 repeat protein
MYKILKCENFVLESLFSPDGKIIASAREDDIITLWDFETGTKLRDLMGHSDSVYSIDFSHNGKLLVTASRDTTIKIWEVETGECLKTLEGHDDFVEYAVFSP